MLISVISIYVPFFDESKTEHDFRLEFKKGTVFKMTSSWKPSLEQFRAALEQDFKIESIINNADMAIAIIRPELG